MKKNRVFTEEHKKNISLAKKGRIPWNKGIPHTAAARKKMSENHRDVSGENNPMFGVRRYGVDSPNYGKRYPEEIRKKFASYGTRGKKRSLELRASASKAFLGSKNPMWKGGVTSLNVLIRNCSQYAEWRRLVYQRDSWQCQKCGISRDLESHHKTPLYQIISTCKITSLEDAFGCKELWDISNGITLCSNCHIEVDNYRGLRKRSLLKAEII